MKCLICETRLTLSGAVTSVLEIMDRREVLEFCKKHDDPDKVMEFIIGRIK